MTTKARKKRKKGKKIIWILILIAAVVGIFIWKMNGNKDVTPVVTITKAYRGDLQEQLIIEGTVGGEDTVSIYAPASGSVKNVYVRAGDEVKKGELLAAYDLDKLDKELYQAQLQNERTRISYENTLDNNADSEGKIKEADVNLSVLKKQIEDHEQYLKDLQKELSDYLAKQSNDGVLQSYNLKKRMSELQERILSLTPGTEEYENAAGELEAVQNQLEQLTLKQSLQEDKTDRQKELEQKIALEQETLADLKEYRAKMEAQKTKGEATVLDKYGSRQLEIDMELTELAYQKMLAEAELARGGVISDVQGIIKSITVSENSQVASGVPLMTIERTDAMKITATASQYALERLKVGQKADAVIGSKTYPAEVSHVNRYASAGALKGTTGVEFELKLLEIDEAIYIGAFSKVTIYANKAENALLLPMQAVRANKNGDFVYVVENGIIVRKPITCGIITNGKAEILSGITEADDVVLDYAASVEEGMEVLTKTEASEDR